jgi:hypothetical protein
MAELIEEAKGVIDNFEKTDYQTLGSEKGLKHRNWDDCRIEIENLKTQYQEHIKKAIKEFEIQLKECESRSKTAIDNKLESYASNELQPLIERYTLEKKYLEEKLQESESYKGLFSKIKSDFELGFKNGLQSYISSGL